MDRKTVCTVAILGAFSSLTIVRPAEAQSYVKLFQLGFKIMGSVALGLSANALYGKLKAEVCAPDAPFHDGASQSTLDMLDCGPQSPPQLPRPQGQDQGPAARAAPPKEVSTEVLPSPGTPPSSAHSRKERRPTAPAPTESDLDTQSPDVPEGRSNAMLAFDLSLPINAGEWSGSGELDLRQGGRSFVLSGVRALSQPGRDYVQSAGAKAFASRLEGFRGHVRCIGTDDRGYTCFLVPAGWQSWGYDVAELAIFVGAAVPLTGAPASYSDTANVAQSKMRGNWALQ